MPSSDSSGSSPPTVTGEDTALVSAADRAFVRQFRVTVLNGPDAGRSLASSRARSVIGTHASADIALRDSTVSRFHCEIVIDGGRALLRDLESRNGTRIEGVPIVEAYLESGVTISLGQTDLRFDLGADRIEIPLSSRERFGELSAVSAAMRAVFAVLERAAESDATLLLLGETGTGKDAAAESVHRESSRKEGPFIVVDCGAVPEGLLESELFGHERGAFTGAERPRAGAFELADGGTVFLDEIGELDLALQPALLRALEQRSVKRVGGTKRLSFDVRVIAATNRNLQREVNAGRFRADLYYRLAVLEVMVPPLRGRKEDLPVLVGRLLEHMGEVTPGTRQRLTSSGFVADLMRHSWPGNVRELRNYLERCVAFDQPVPLRTDVTESLHGPTPVDIEQPLGVLRERWVRHLERTYIEQMLEREGHNVSAAARAAGVDRVQFYRLMARCGLK